jgi:hypothetical protein
MQVQKLNFPLVIPDNESTYLNYLIGLIESVDYDSDMMIYRKNDGILVRISPSTNQTFITILDIIKKFHTMLSIQVEFSKSMKAGSNITYSINF